MSGAGFTITNIYQHPRYSESAMGAGDALKKLATIFGWEQNEMIPESGPVQLTEVGIIDCLDRNHSGKIDRDDFKIETRKTYGAIWSFRSALLILAQTFKKNDSDLLLYMDEPEGFTFASYQAVGVIPPLGTETKTYAVLSKDRCGVRRFMDPEKATQSPADYLFMSGEDFVAEMDSSFGLKAKVAEQFPTLEDYTDCEM